MQFSRRIALPADFKSLRVASDLVREFDDEIIPVRHLHLRQGLGIHRITLADELVGGEDVGGERIDLVVAERARVGPGHRTADVVEQRRGIGPEILDGLERLDAVALELALGDERGAPATLAALAVTGDAAFLDIELGAFAGSAAAG